MSVVALKADVGPVVRSELAETSTATQLNTSTQELSENTRNYRFFDPFWLPRTERARAFVASVIGRIDAQEQALRLRKRKRKEAHQANFEEGIAALLSDLVRLVLWDPGRSLGVSLRNGNGGGSRYERGLKGKPLKRIVNAIGEDGLGLVATEKGTREWKQVWTGTSGLIHIPDDTPTLLHPAPRFIKEIEVAGLEPEEFKRSEKEEIIILRARKKRKDRSGDLLDYKETAWTIGARDKLREVNRWLTEANIEDDGWGDLDTSLRTSYRVFNNGSFEDGGRLYGNFWLDIKKTRRRYLRIDGEPVAELDYGQMGLRLLYASIGVQPEGDDLYVVNREGFTREGVKKLIHSAISTNKRLSRMPRGLRRHVPGWVSCAQALEIVEDRHHPVKHLFFKGLGLKLQVQEADIMVALLLALRDQGIIALPIHDCVLVPVSKATETKATMLSIFKEMTGIEGVVNVRLPSLH